VVWPGRLTAVGAVGESACSTRKSISTVLLDKFLAFKPSIKRILFLIITITEF
jgi:hypothetical protein